MTLSESIIKVLTESQNSLNSHQRLLKSLTATYKKEEDPNTFFEAFFPPFSNVLVVFKREPAVERVIDFVAKFAVLTAPREEEVDENSGSENESPTEPGVSFFSLLIDKALSLHQARDKAVRFRVCQLVGKLMNYSAESECIVGSDRLEKVQQVMLERAYDKIPIVRVNAVISLEYLQVAESECPVIAALLDLMGRDSSPDVRRCILSKIAVTDLTLPAVIERTRDVKDVIRREAFLWLSNKCSIKNLTIKQRIQLLSDGLNNRSDMVQEACVNGLLRSWSLESLDGDLIMLLSRLDVESSSEVVELALVKLFDNFSLDELTSSMIQLMVMINTKPEVWGEELDSTPRPNTSSSRSSSNTPRLSITPSRTNTSQQGASEGGMDDTLVAEPQKAQVKTIPLDLLRCEEAFYWSCLCKYLHNKGTKGEECLESIVPSISVFCDYVQRYVHDVLLAVKEDDVEGRLQSQFVAQQLFSILSVMDLSDEVGRHKLEEMVCDFLLLPWFPAALTEPLMSLQTRLWPQEKRRVEKITEVIADLRQPASVNATLQTGEQTLDSQESQLSTTLSLSFIELREDSETLLRCLALTGELLKELHHRKLNPTLRTLVDALLLPCIQNENPYVRDMALYCLGLACLLDIDAARNNILLFLQVSQVDHESVQATALKVVFDLLHVYGFDAFNVGKSKEDLPSEDKQTENGDGGDTTEAAADVDNTLNVESTTESPLSKEQEDGVATTIGDGELEMGEGRGGGDSESEEKDEVTQKVLKIMADFLEGESSLLRQVSAEGIAKLLLSGRVLSQKLLAKLLILWYNPVTQDEDHLRSVLGTFFPLFAASDRSCRECLSEVYIPVMEMVFEAPPSSPLLDIDVSNMADFIIHLTRPTDANEDSVHDSLAIAVSNAILSDPTTTDIRVYCRSLSLMEFTPSNQSNASDLLVLLEKMTDEVSDRTSLRYLAKYATTLKKICPDYTAPSKEGQPQEEAAPQSGDNTTAIPSTPAPSTALKTRKARTTTTKANKGRTQAKSTVKRKTAGSKATSKTTTKKGQGGRKRRGVTFIQESSSEDSDNENANIENVPQRITSTRLSKSIATKKLAEGNDVRTALTYGDSDDASDDSLVGEHSPFVRHTASRGRHSPSKALQYSDEET